MGCNPDWRRCSRAIGDGLDRRPRAARDLIPLAGDAGFRERFASIKRGNKERAGRGCPRPPRPRARPDALFDVQIKRIHEYKRQLLNLLEAVALWAAIRGRPATRWTPRVKLFAGKAAQLLHAPS